MKDEPKEGETVETSEGARREFLAKAAAAAGAVIAGGLAGMLSSEAEAAQVSTAATAQRMQMLRDAPVRYAKLRDGHALEMKSTELTNILAREGLISKDLMGKQALMRVEVRYSL
jgi:hypothetical protein